eukprot:Cvel_24003.t2-p1 / transcript=Cvel_24003.t2 / gene=Cvel_24003 / organism=Chromera_velia_CCMP2878 / gene_product=hypothetical protein / transcript_product=hypothetical protein / location=Cvel_scaffold2545:1958-8541(+) / protein_length=1080 / sequence_SO=supercontig / SO=protein_coding / is_pseudo=false
MFESCDGRTSPHGDAWNHGTLQLSPMRTQGAGEGGGEVAPFRCISDEASHGWTNPSTTIGGPGWEVESPSCGLQRDDFERGDGGMDGVEGGVACMDPSMHLEGCRCGEFPPEEQQWIPSGERGGMEIGEGDGDMPPLPLGVGMNGEEEGDDGRLGDGMGLEMHQQSPQPPLFSSSSSSSASAGMSCAYLGAHGDALMGNGEGGGHMNPDGSYSQLQQQEGGVGMEAGGNSVPRALFVSSSKKRAIDESAIEALRDNSSADTLGVHLQQQQQNGLLVVPAGTGEGGQGVHDGSGGFGPSPGLGYAGQEGQQLPQVQMQAGVVQGGIWGGGGAPPGCEGEEGDEVFEDGEGDGDGMTVTPSERKGALTFVSSGSTPGGNRGPPSVASGDSHPAAGRLLQGHQQRERDPLPDLSGLSEQERVLFMKERKKEQNRVSAVRSRARKKNEKQTKDQELEDLRDRVASLSVENASLHAENRLLKGQVGFLMNKAFQPNHQPQQLQTQQSQPQSSQMPVLMDGSVHGHGEDQNHEGDATMEGAAEGGDGHHARPLYALHPEPRAPAVPPHSSRSGLGHIGRGGGAQRRGRGRLNGTRGRETAAVSSSGSSSSSSSASASGHQREFADALAPLVENSQQPQMLCFRDPTHAFPMDALAHLQNQQRHRQGQQQGFLGPGGGDAFAAARAGGSSAQTGPPLPVIRSLGPGVQAGGGQFGGVSGEGVSVGGMGGMGLPETGVTMRVGVSGLGGHQGSNLEDGTAASSSSFEGGSIGNGGGRVRLSGRRGGGLSAHSITFLGALVCVSTISEEMGLGVGADGGVAGASAGRRRRLEAERDDGVWLEWAVYASVLILVSLTLTWLLRPVTVRIAPVVFPLFAYLLQSCCLPLFWVGLLSKDSALGPPGSTSPFAVAPVRGVPPPAETQTRMKRVAHAQGDSTLLQRVGRSLRLVLFVLSPVRQCVGGRGREKRDAAGAGTEAASTKAEGSQDSGRVQTESESERLEREKEGHIASFRARLNYLLWRAGLLQLNSFQYASMCLDGQRHAQTKRGVEKGKSKEGEPGISQEEALHSTLPKGAAESDFLTLPSASKM